MSIRSQIGTFALALTLGLTAACSPPSGEGTTGDRQQADGTWYGKYPNGEGLYVSATSQQNRCGIQAANGAPTYHLSGFTNGGPSVVVDGWYLSSPTYIPAKGTVVSGELNGKQYPVASIDVKEVNLAVTLVDGSNLIILDGDKLQDLILHLSVPNAGSSTGREKASSPYSVFFKGMGKIDGVAQGLIGYAIYSVPDSVPGATPSSLCWRDDQQRDELVTFLSGAQWDKNSTMRQASGKSVSLACESGAIHVCQQWGYVPFGTSVSAKSGTDVSLEAAHDACIPMKRADYCRTGAHFTEDGTQISIADAFNPAIQKGGGTHEGIFGQKGAFCLDKPRHPELLPASMIPPAGSNASLICDPLDHSKDHYPCTASSYGNDWWVESFHQ